MSILTPPPGDGKARAGRKCELTLDSITADDRLQMRAGGSPPEVVNEYATAMRAGDTFPPVIVFYDGENMWLADGFTRFAAARKACRPKIAAEVFDGTRENAREYAWVANDDQKALRRSWADKRRAVEDCLEAHPDWSDGKIAEKTLTSGPFVAGIRPKVPTANVCTTRVGRDGKTRRGPQPKPAEPAPAAPTTQQPHAQQPDSTSAPANQLTDQLGRPVPANLREVFAERAKLTAAVESGRQFLKDLRSAEKSPAGVVLKNNAIPLSQLENLDFDLLDVRAPFCVCPSCAGAGAEGDAKCECAGNGWLTRTAFENLLPALKAKATAFGKQPEPLPSGAKYVNTQRDGVGMPIPLRLRDDFAFDVILYYLRELKSLVHLLDGAKGWLHWLRPEAHEIGAQFVRLVEDSLPFAVCQHCGGKGKGCAHCNTSGYFPKHLHENGHNKPAPKRGAN